MIVKRFLEYEHEVMFRVMSGGGKCSLSTIEPKLMAAATALVNEGYLRDAGSWPQAGRTRTGYHLVTERCSMQHLKDHL